MPIACSVHGAPRRGLSGSIKGDDKGKLKFSNQLVYRVKVNDPAEAKDATYWDAITASGLPVVNLSVYSIGGLWIPYSICRGKSAKQDPKNIQFWDVTCDFESPKSEDGEEDNEPVDKPAAADDVAPRIEYSSETIDVVVWDDINGDAITNPVGEHFAEPTTRPLTLVVANLTFYMADFPFDRIADHGGKVNSATWNGKPRYAWMISDVKRSPAKIPIAGDPGDPDAEPPVPPTPDSELSLYQVSYTIKYNPQDHGWKSSKLLTATKYLDNINDTIDQAVPFMDEKNNQPTTGFVGRDGLRSATPVYKDFEHIPVLDFDTIFPALTP